MPDPNLSRPGGQINPQRSMTGVRHLTEDLIRNTVRDTPLDSITILKLNFSEISGKKIKVIENLERLRRLHTLNLAGNMIERLEHLDALVRLKDLDVSHNRLTKIEGLEKLANLVSLNLEGNQLQTIPAWLAKKLKALRNLRLASNNISSLQEIRRLRGLPNLTFLTIAHNPVCDLPHYRLYIIFHLRSLDVLDGRRINVEERMEAARRFDQEEIDALHAEVNEMQQKFEHLQEDHNRSLQELENSHRNDSQLAKVTRENQQRIRELQVELGAKEDIIGRKQAELSRANQKHYELEQELAFYKIDTKFTSLHKKPDTPSGADDGESLMESPYIGKSQHAKDRPDWPAASRRPPNRTPQRRRASDSSPDSLMDTELEHKQKQIDDADRKLELLTNQLRHTELRVANAAEHLVKLSALADRSADPLPESEREQLEDKLDSLHQTIDELVNNREQLLDNLDKNAADISEAEQHLDEVDRSLDSSDLEDSEKEALLVERDDKEAFLAKAKDMRDDLEQALADLEQVLEQKKAEAGQIQQQLAKAGADNSQPEIGNVAEEVKSILTSLKQGQTSGGDTQALRARLAQLEEAVASRDKACHQLERSLQEEKDAREHAQQQLETSQHDPSKAQLQAEVKRLRELNEQMEHEARQLPRPPDDSNLKKELAKLKRENDRLKRDGELGRSLTDAEMVSRLDAMVEKAQSGQPLETNAADPIERRLVALQKALDEDRKQAERDAKKLKEDKARLEQKVANLSAALAEEARSRDTASTGSESNALVDMLRRELDVIRAEMAGQGDMKRQLADVSDRLRKTQAELDRAKQASRATDQPRLNPSRFNRYSVPPQFDLDAGLDDSYDDSESTRDTVRRMPSSRRAPSRFDERTDGGGHGSTSQNSGRVTDENPRLSAPPKQGGLRVPPHPDDVMSIQSEAPTPYGHPRHPNTDQGAKGGRSGDRRRAGPGRGLGTVPEAYESDVENPRQRAPRPNPEMHRMQQELARADDEIDKLQQLLAERDKNLDETLQRTGAAEDVIERQRDETDGLRRELELYKQEVDRLRALLAAGDQQMPPAIQPISEPAQPYNSSASFIQGPTFKPGQLDTSDGQVLTSTPYRGYQQPLQQQPLQQQPLQQQPLQQQPLQQQPLQQAIAQQPVHVEQTLTALAPPTNQLAPPNTLHVAHTLPSNQIASNQPTVQSQPVADTYRLVSADQAPGTLTTVTAPAKVTLVSAATSSPTKTVVLNASASTPVKSILKTSERNGLVCTVPQHHQLEDEHSKLRTKYKSLKSSLKKSSMERKEEHNLAGQTKAAVELKHALKERKSELESLDLAINMQRQQLHTLKNHWRLVREGSRSDRPTPENTDDEEWRQSEIEHYMNTELECLEETLAKRRTELREADKRLIDCRDSLQVAKEEANQMISQYELVKGQVDTVEAELSVLEHHKVEKQEEVAQMMVDIKKLSSDKDLLEEQMQKIEGVTKEKDVYFNSLSQRIESAQTALADLQTSIKQQTIEAEQNLHEIKMEAERHLASVRHSEAELTEHYTDIRDIKSVLSQREQQLSSLNSDLGNARQELSLLQSQTDEQKTSLSGVESEVKVVTDKLKDRRAELSSLNSLEREMKERLEGRKELLENVKDKIEDEKEALQTLTMAVEQKEDQLSVLKKSLLAARAESAELLREISERRCLLESLTAESNVVERELGELRSKHAEGRQLLDKLEFESNAASSVLDKLRVERDATDRAVNDKMTELKQQTQKLEVSKAALAEVTNTHQQLTNQIKDKTNEYEQLQGRMRQLQSEVDDMKFDKGNAESQLESVSKTLKEQRLTASKLKKVLKDMDSKKGSLSAECESLEQRNREMEQQLHQLKYEYQQVNSGLLEAKAELNEQQLATDELRQDVCRLNEERGERQRALKELTSQYDKENQQLTQMTERAEGELSHMRDQQQACQSRVAELTRELSRLMSEINKNRKEHGDLTEVNAKLQQAEAELEGERTTNADLMKRLTEFAQRLQMRNDSLTKVKKQSDGHIHSLSEELTQVKKECRSLREKKAAEMEDLEWIAQQHAQRADRLNVELEATRHQVEALNKTVMALQLQAGKDEKLADTISTLKQNIQQEVSLGMAELERSRAEATSELDQLRAQKAFITNEVISLKENLDRVQSRQLDCQRSSRVKERSVSPRKSSGNVRRKLDAEQEVVRKRMHEQMQRHLDAMEGMKAHSMNILTDLQDRVSSLQGVLSESTSSIHNTPSPPHRPVRDSLH